MVALVSEVDAQQREMEILQDFDQLIEERQGVRSSK